MDATADDRLRSAVLFGAAVAALTVGGWWWHAAAPASTVGSAAFSAAASPTVGPSVSTALDRALVVRAAGERLTIVGPTEMVRTEIDSATGMITDIEGDPSWLFFQGELPSFRETIWREQTALVPGERVVRQAAGSDSRQLLQYRCTRPGTLLVTIFGADLSGPSEIDCDGMTTSAEVFSHGRPFRVSLATAAEREIDVEAQLVTLPR
ncbi:hypothetical protein [Micromonospora sp. NBC_01638]|uniref:hypothetical protein n=1 Tax=Micromonospora sp. NBC_01638 TaxID=2975982 RepID=UPI0038646789|nr:hypothetical protein OG811_08720 [Micromonospora sp. NBC_01638]